MGTWTDFWWNGWFGDYEGEWIKQAKFILRKLLHVIIFASLGCCWAAHRYLGRTRVRWSVCALILLGVASELSQLGAPGRRPRVTDALLNGVAAVGAMLIYRRVTATGRPSRGAETKGYGPGIDSRVERVPNKGKGRTGLRPPGPGGMA